MTDTLLNLPNTTAATKTLDIVYPCRPGDRNEELRYSLRCLEQHFPQHGTIWIVGHKPTWLTGVEFIPGNTGPTSQANVYRNIQAACEHPDLPDEFLIFNDDFLATAPITNIDVHYRGLLRDHLALPRVRRNPDNWWAQSLRTTLICLQANGIEDPLSYELHVPLPVNKHAMAETLARFAAVTPKNPPQWRSLYGNMNRIGGTQAKDCKAYKPGTIHTPWHSTDDASWRHFRKHFTQTFPEPSRYEKAASDHC